MASSRQSASGNGVLGKRKALASLDSNTALKRGKPTPELVHTGEYNTDGRSEQLLSPEVSLARGRKPLKLVLVDSSESKAEGKVLRQGRKPLKLVLVDSSESKAEHKVLRQGRKPLKLVLVDSSEFKAEDKVLAQGRNPLTLVDSEESKAEYFTDSVDDEPSRRRRRSKPSQNLLGIDVPSNSTDFPESDYEDEEDLGATDAETIDDDLEGENPDEDVFDEDPHQDGHDPDAKEKAEQAEQLKAWFLDCEKKDNFSSLKSEERRQRMERCQKRIEDMVPPFVKTARDIAKAAFTDPVQKEQLPMTFPWWAMFFHVDPKKLVDLLLPSIPDAVKVVLGGPLDQRELLLLPDVDWRGCSLWAVYTDVLTTVVDGAEVEIGRYVGSTVAKEGLYRRLGKHTGVQQGRLQAEQGKHHDWVLKPNVKMNLRVLAVFDATEVPRPYVLVMELFMTTLLQTLTMRTCGVYCTASAVAMIRRTTPEGLPKVKHEPLNSAIQCLQGLWHSRSRDSHSVLGYAGIVALTVTGIMAWHVLPRTKRGWSSETSVELVAAGVARVRLRDSLGPSQPMAHHVPAAVALFMGARTNGECQSLHSDGIDGSAGLALKNRVRNCVPLEKT
ncbi:MAG: hypothetical protein L6R39_006614 [Caloplaca ligustica]|nr:MAG: hypothetical protein L6R39_006614 [Caloplaca ligustica]